MDLEHHQQTWFKTWFDTNYYHILYQHRDNQEAELLIDHLVSYLNITPSESILDLACGRGRHAIYLASKGYDVTGYDLSENNILFANEFDHEHLKFKVQDMRHTYPDSFDIVMNLFTSFGYFDTLQDNISTLKSIKKCLKSNGIGIIDFLNLDYVKNNIVEEETKTIDDITFNLKRRIENGYIIKDILFEDQGQQFHFTEKVQALQLSDFVAMMQEAQIQLLEIFGDYKLSKFDSKNSERLIMIFQ